MSPLPSVGSDFAGYRIERLLGRGGMAEVYLAQHMRLGRHVALKLLSPELVTDETFRERFVRESRQAAAIDHPNNIPIYEAGEVDGVLYIAMRFVAGVDLKVLIRREGQLDISRTMSILGQVASALDAAHAQGLMHRDVKPANILLLEAVGADGFDHAYLSDFGLSKQQNAVSDLTATGQFVGTIDYTAPEQIEGKLCDGRTDLYALGCMLYECLTGRLPFERDTEVSTMFAHLLDAPPKITKYRPELPTGVDDVLAKALAKDKDDRYSTCAEFMAAMRAVLAQSGLAAPSAPVHRQDASPGGPLPPPSPRTEAPPPLRRAAPTPPPVKAAPAATPAPHPAPPPVRQPSKQPTWRLGQPRPKPDDPG